MDKYHHKSGVGITKEYAPLRFHKTGTSDLSDCAYIIKVFILSYLKQLLLWQ